MADLASRRRARRASYVRLIRRCVLTVFLLAAASRHAAAGDTNLDPAFGTGGFVLSGSWRELVTDLSPLPDGRVVAVGLGLMNGIVGTVWLYTANGAPDPSFGVGGRVDLGSAASSLGVVKPSGLYGVAVAPDGKIVVAGHGAVEGLPSGESNPVSLIYRLDASGALDPTFGDNGRVIVNLLPSGSGPTPREESLEDVVVQADGRIVAVGRCSGAPACVNENLGAMVIRLLPDGTLDPSFDVDGVVNTAVATAVEGHVVDALSDGRLLVAGFGGGRGVIFRLLPDGTVDPTFGDFHDACYFASRPASECAGYAVTTAAIRSVPGIVGMARDGTDRIIVAGKTELPDDHDEVVVERYLADGTLDATFGNGGVVQHPTAPTITTYVSDMVRLPDGKLLVAGTTQTQGDDDPGIALFRLTSDGTPDTTFTPDGFARIDLQGGYTLCHAVGALPDGRTLVGGEYSPVATRFAVEGFVAQLGGLCGNGVLDPFEDCDDGNSLGFDCCSSGCRFDAPGSSCDLDDRACTFDSCDGVGTCTAGGGEPVCRAVIVPLSSQVKMARRPTGDVFRWKWLRGQWTDVDEFGFPDYLTRFTMCFHEGANLAGEIEFPVGAGWRLVPNDVTPRGLVYRGTSSPIRRVQLKAGVDGEASIRVTAKGLGFGLPPLPMSLPATVRLLNDRGECWAAQYESADVNDGSKLSAEGD